MNKLVLPVLCAIGLAFVPVRNDAGLHGPPGFKGYVDTGAQRGLVFWDNGREELVLQPGWTIATSTLAGDEYNDAGLLKNFDEIAWVVPLPTLPDRYAAVDADLFDDMDEFAKVVSRVPEPEGGSDVDDGPVISDGSETADVKMYEVVDVGDYTIQPIKSGEKELSDWFKSNGFGEFDERVLRWYNQNNYCWLAVKATAKGGLPPDGTLKPLHISFKTPRPVYPYKIYDKRGAFNLELFVVTRDSIDLTKSRHFGIDTPEQAADFRQQKNREVSYIKLPETVRAIADGAEDLKALRASRVCVYRFVGRNIENDELGLDLATLQEELHFEFEKDVAEKPKDEVKPTETPKDGDGDEPESPGEDKPDDDMK
ncbi:MAG: DUF2330 domain-containing protein [Planctomycetes bacterium]|nr:DUF2330 domain-containing protein [Planctomycetota bacterium]